MRAGLGFFVALACGAGCGPIELAEVGAEPAPEVRTVLVATWTTDRPCVGEVAYAAEGGPDFVTAPEPAATNEHRRLLLNLPSNREVTFVARCSADGDVVESAPTVASTSTLPPELADVEVVGTPEESTDLLLVPLLGGTHAAAMFDLAGHVVWYHLESDAVQMSRARRSSDGESVLYFATPADPTDESAGAVVRVGFDGVERARYAFHRSNHDFLELPDGTIVAITEEWREVEGVRRLGNRLVEMAADGERREVWTTFDSFDPARQPSNYLEDAGWSHANALDYDETTDGYWLGLRNFDAIVHVDRATGAVTEQVGGRDPTLSFADPADAFHGQHQFQWLADGLLVFDNDYGRQASRAVEYGLDSASGVLTKRWEYRPDPPIWNYALGDVDRDAAGGTRITYTTAGLMVQVNADDTVRWQINAPLGIGFGYSERVSALREGGAP